MIGKTPAPGEADSSYEPTAPSNLCNPGQKFKSSSSNLLERNTQNVSKVASRMARKNNLNGAG
jgi:hypothetical protein